MKKMINNMTKEEKKEYILTAIVCLIPIIVGMILYNRLPDQIATHWDVNGNVNGESSRFVGVIVFPGVLAVINLLFPLLLRIDPKYENMDGRLKAITHWIIPALSVFCSGITLTSALGVGSHVEIIAPMFFGFLLVLIGNYLPKTKQSYSLGIRVPWTLNSEENWNHTHRMAGFLWVMGGVLIIVFSFFKIRLIAFSALILILTIAPIVYSYYFYCRESAGREENNQ